MEVKKNGASIAQFVYDGDGKRVKSVINGETTHFVGSHYEKIINGSATKYYLAGTSMIALRKDGVLNFVLSDHLGSTSITTDTSGSLVSELRYKAWGEVRYSSGTQQTKHTYTGQYSNVSDFGLMFYQARWYDSSLGRFTQPDSIIPEQTQGTQAWDRFGGMNNNPVRFNDPSGHCIVDGCIIEFALIAYSPLILMHAFNAWHNFNNPSAFVTPSIAPTATLNPTVSALQTEHPLNSFAPVPTQGPAWVAAPTATATPLPTSTPEPFDIVQTSEDVINLFGPSLDNAPDYSEFLPGPVPNPFFTGPQIIDLRSSGESIENVGKILWGVKELGKSIFSYDVDTGSPTPFFQTPTPTNFATPFPTPTYMWPTPTRTPTPQ